MLLVRLFIGLLLVAAFQRHTTGSDFERFSGFCRRTASEIELLQDVSDGNLDDCSLVRAALICAGHTEAATTYLEGEFQAGVRRCRSVVQAAAKGRVKEAIFRYLKNDFLYGAYQADLFDVGRTIKHGDFNCLTATILYQAFCREFSLEANCVWEPSHVRCWVAQGHDGMGFVVETTASTVAEAVGPRTSVHELTDRLLTRTELLGKVLYNRGVTALVNEQFATALSATWASSLLDPLDYPAWNNLRACLNNWALAAVESERLDIAKLLLEEGMRLDPDYEPFRSNQALLRGN